MNILIFSQANYILHVLKKYNVHAELCFFFFLHVKKQQVKERKQCC